VAVLRMHVGDVQTGQLWNPRNEGRGMLLTGDSCGVVKVWSLESYRCLATHRWACCLQLLLLSCLESVVAIMCVI
jgi:hypothetical protein